MGSALLVSRGGLLICFNFCEMWVCGMVPRTMNQCNYLCSWWDKNDKEQKCAEYMWSFKWSRLLRAVSSSAILFTSSKHSAVVGIESPLLWGFQPNPQIEWRKQIKYALIHSWNSGNSQHGVSAINTDCLLKTCRLLYSSWNQSSSFTLIRLVFCLLGSLGLCLH